MESTPLSPSSNLPLYSSRAISVFALLFSPITAGILVAQNFKDVGRPDAARKVLWISISCTLLVMIVLSLLPERASGNTGLSVGLGIGGGYALNIYSDKVIHNKQDFPAKSIVKPLLICLLIFIALIIFLIYPLFS